MITRSELDVLKANELAIFEKNIEKYAAKFVADIIDKILNEDYKLDIWNFWLFEINYLVVSADFYLFYLFLEDETKLDVSFKTIEQHHTKHTNLFFKKVKEKLREADSRYTNASVSKISDYGSSYKVSIRI